jgi:hypothetical protein
MFSQAVQVMSTHVGTGSGGRCGGWAVRSPPNDIPYAVKGLRHIAIVVPDLSVAAEHYRSVFGAQVSDPVVCLQILLFSFSFNKVCIQSSVQFGGAYADHKFSYNYCVESVSSGVYCNHLM